MGNNMVLSAAEIEREVRYTQQFFSSDEFTSSESAGKIESHCREIIATFARLATHVEPLQQGERAIMTLTRQKTAALLADRVWGADDAEDRSIAFGWSSQMELRFRALLALNQYFERAPSAPDPVPLPLGRVESFMDKIERDIAFDLQKNTGATVIPLYASEADRNFQFRPGNETALLAIISNLNIVDEEKLSWHQVSEFRKDAQAKTAYRQFVHWLDKDMIDKSVSYIVDEINFRREKYEWSLRKHGITTLLGAFSNILNPTSLISSSSAALAVNVIAGKPIWSLLAAGGLLFGHATVSLSTALVERQDIALANREIAYVQQLQSTLGSK